MPCHTIPYHTCHTYHTYHTLHYIAIHYITLHYTLHTIHLGNPTCQWRSVVSGTDGQPRWPAPRSSGIQFWAWWNPFHLPSGYVKIAIEHGPVEISLIFPISMVDLSSLFFETVYQRLNPHFPMGFPMVFPMVFPWKEDVVEQEEPGRFCNWKSCSTTDMIHMSLIYNVMGRYYM